MCLYCRSITSYWSLIERAIGINPITNKRISWINIKSMSRTWRLFVSQSSLLYWREKRQWRCFQTWTWDLGCFWHTWKSFWYDSKKNFQDKLNKDACPWWSWRNAKSRIQGLSLWYLQISTLWNSMCCSISYTPLRNPRND